MLFFEVDDPAPYLPENVSYAEITPFKAFLTLDSLRSVFIIFYSFKKLLVVCNFFLLLDAFLWLIVIDFYCSNWSTVASEASISDALVMDMLGSSECLKLIAMVLHFLS